MSSVRPDVAFGVRRRLRAIFCTLREKFCLVLKVPIGLFCIFVLAVNTFVGGSCSPSFPYCDVSRGTSSTTRETRISFLRDQTSKSCCLTDDEVPGALRVHGQIIFWFVSRAFCGH